MADTQTVLQTVQAALVTQAGTLDNDRQRALFWSLVCAFCRCMGRDMETHPS